MKKLLMIVAMVAVIGMTGTASAAATLSTAVESALEVTAGAGRYLDFLAQDVTYTRPVTGETATPDGDWSWPDDSTGLCVDGDGLVNLVPGGGDGWDTKNFTTYEIEVVVNADANTVYDLWLTGLGRSGGGVYSVEWGFTAGADNTIASFGTAPGAIDITGFAGSRWVR